MLLGKLGVEGGVDNFAVLPGGILVANANRLWLVEGLKVNGGRLRGILDCMVKRWGMI